MIFVKAMVSSLLVLGWEIVSVVGPDTVVVECVSVKVEKPSV